MGMISQSRFARERAGQPSTVVLLRRGPLSTKYEVAVVTRYYFHLVDGYDVIPDEVGLDVADLTQAHVEASRVLCEFRRACAATAAASRDWCVEVADASGAVALRIDLRELAENG